MRNLADLTCSQCGRAFYGDLAAGQALYSPALLEKETGQVHAPDNTSWFARWLGESYARRMASPVAFDVEEFKPVKQPVLLNCLDALYGHCLLKLLNAQYYLDHGYDLIVMVPRFLRWMVPEGVAVIWTVDWPLAHGTEWNDWLAAEIKRRLEPLETVWLSVAFSHPHPDDYTIERFTRVHPFPIDEWDARLAQPKVTFIWREDRLWCDVRQHNVLYRAARKLGRAIGVLPKPLEEQTQRLGELARALRLAFPNVDLAVAGVGQPGGLPAWIADLRTTEIRAETERAWCERYASSHVVIGVHGSNMLLPSAHAGAVIELVPEDRWGNLIQDILPQPMDPQELLFRYRFFPLETCPATVAQTTESLLHEIPDMRLRFGRPWNEHRLFTTDAWFSDYKHRARMPADLRNGGNQTK